MTDSRYRTDQRALENGDLKLAASEKIQIENSQRAIRKQWEEEGREFKPKYFERDYDSDTNEYYYKFNYLYWKDRQNRDWS